MQAAKWYSLYDQGFVILNQGQRFVANFRYEVSGSKTMATASKNL